MRSTRPLYDVVALLARIGVGVVFLAHGWQKIQVGVTATADSFDRMGVPAPTAAAIYATFAELLGGLALIAGLGLPVAGTLLFLDMAGALVFVHAGNGLFLVDQGRARNGFELVLVLGLASLLFAAGAGGRISLDHRLFPRRAPDAPPPPAPASPAPASPAPTAPETTRPKAAPVKAASDTAPDEKPPAAEPPAETAAPKPRSGRPSARSRKKQTGTPNPDPEPEGEPPAAPASRPRLASDIIGDTGQDVFVAGRRKPRGKPGPGTDS
ncbi:putative oxidoreductase [Thermomonospora echinospora]|uniref:Putative oxidoreductase n=1 Tax=Thermomonospora echinospora TaxID=1992 RepID=A0A1H5XZP8_9ACTN|nr:DoxX family protein [Thermomonospora echinospora]SEG16756.1 putative oxidoreductase [Thermomonospora echinospora]